MSSLAILPPSARAEVAAVKAVVALGAALHRAGMPANDLEHRLDAVSRGLGLQARFLSTPTALQAVFEDGERPWIEILRLPPASVDLDRLARLDRLADDLRHRRVAPDLGARRAAAIDGSAPPYGGLLTVLAGGVASATAAQMFGGGVTEIGLAGGVGAVVAAMYAALSERMGAVLDPLATAVACGLVLLATRFVGAAVEPTLLGALIVLFPGLMLTIAATEVATGHWVSGSARMVGAGVAFVQLGFGLALALHLVASMPGPAPVAAPLPWWADWVALVGGLVAMNVLLRAPRRDHGWITLGGLVGYVTARFGSEILGPELGAFPAAFAIALAARLYARITGRAAVVVSIPGIVLLVPGSMGMRSLSALLLSADADNAVKIAFSVAMVAASIVAGTMLAEAVLGERR